MSVRVARAEDAAAVAAIYAPYVLETQISFELTPPTAGEIAARMDAVAGRYPWLVHEREGRVVGYAYASPHAQRAAYAWSVDTAVYVARDACGGGVGRGLYAALLPILRRQGFHRAYAGVSLPNPASVRLHESFGFVGAAMFDEVGFKLGAWRDVGWWSLALSPPSADPAPPAPFSAALLDP